MKDYYSLKRLWLNTVTWGDGGTFPGQIERIEE